MAYLYSNLLGGVMFFREKSVLLALFAITACVAQSTFGADETNETLMPKGMWKDPDTGLIWMRCSLGETWNGSGCDGERTYYSWWNAIKAIDKLTFAGQKDWRLPTISELSSLIGGKVLRGKKGYDAWSNQIDGGSTWSNLSQVQQNDYEQNNYYSSVEGYKTTSIFKVKSDESGIRWSATPSLSSNTSAWYISGNSSAYGHKADPSPVRAVRSSQSLSSAAFLSFSKLVKQAPSDEKNYKKMLAIEKAQDEIEARRGDVSNQTSNDSSSNQQKESRYVCQFTCLGSAWKRGGTYTLETYAAGSYEAAQNLKDKATDICREEHRTTGSGTTLASFEPCNAK